MPIAPPFNSETGSKYGKIGGKRSVIVRRAKAVIKRQRKAQAYETRLANKRSPIDPDSTKQALREAIEEGVPAAKALLYARAIKVLDQVRPTQVIDNVHKIRYVHSAKPVPQPLTSKHNIEVEPGTTGGVPGIGSSKESLNPGIVGAGCGGGGLPAGGTPGRIAPFTPTAISQSESSVVSALRSEVVRLQARIRELEHQLGKPAPAISQPGVVSKEALPPGCPGPGYEKVRISGVMVWAKRSR